MFGASCHPGTDALSHCIIRISWEQGPLAFPGLVRTPTPLFLLAMCFHVASSVFFSWTMFHFVVLYRCLLVEVEDLTLLVSCLSNIAVLILSM